MSVRTGEEIELGSGARLPNVIALEYSGALSAESRWLQFVWFEMLAIDPTGTSRVSATVPTTSGTKPFTTDPKSPNWSVDSALNEPFYEAGGVNIRNSSSTTIFDAPGGGSVGPLVQAAVAAVPTATSVVFTAHFDTFLIQRGQTSYRVSWSASTAFAISGGVATSPGIGYTVGASGPVNSLPPDKWTVLQHDRPGPWDIR